LRERGDFRPDDVPSDDMDEYLRRKLKNRESKDPIDLALLKLIRINILEYEEKHGKGSWENRAEKENKLLTHYTNSPSWGQRGNNGKYPDIIDSEEMLLVLGNTARTRILVELFKVYTLGNGRLNTGDLCGKLNIGKSTASRVLRELSNNDMVSMGKGGKGHCLDGTSERGERFILTMNSLEGKRRNDEIKYTIESQRRVRDSKAFDQFRNHYGDEKARLLFTVIGDNTPWIYNNVSPDFEDCVVPPKSKSSFEKRYQKWTMASLRRIDILQKLANRKWIQRKEVGKFSSLIGTSNSRISQVLKELIDQDVIDRKRGEGRGEMLYRITEKGLLRLEYYETAPGGLGHIRELPYRGTYVLGNKSGKKKIIGKTWREIENQADSDFDWDKYLGAWD